MNDGEEFLTGEGARRPQRGGPPTVVRPASACSAAKAACKTAAGRTGGRGGSSSPSSSAPSTPAPRRPPHSLPSSLRRWLAGSAPSRTGPRRRWRPWRPPAAGRGDGGWPPVSRHLVALIPIATSGCSTTSGEASSENNLGRFYFKIFARLERRAEAYCPAAGARGGGTRDPLAQLAGTEVGL